MPRARLFRPLGPALLIAGVLVAAVVAAPGTLSKLVSSSRTPQIAVSSGRADLVITGNGGGPGAGVYPGGPAELLVSRTLVNDGDVPLRLRVSASAADDLARSVIVVVSVQPGACAASPPSSAPTATGLWMGAPDNLSAAATPTLSVGATRTLCVWQSLSPDAPDGTFGRSASIAVTVGGVQIAP